MTKLVLATAEKGLMQPQ